VVEGKGGYCFELNGLFAWLLRELGYKFSVRTLTDAEMPEAYAKFGLKY